MKNSKIRTAIYFISPLVVTPILGIALLSFFNSAAYGDGSGSIKVEQTVKGSTETATATVTVTDNVTKSTSVEVSSSVKLETNSEKKVRTETDTTGVTIKTTQGNWTAAISYSTGWIDTSPVGNVPVTTHQPNRSYGITITRKWK